MNLYIQIAPSIKRSFSYRIKAEISTTELISKIAVIIQMVITTNPKHDIYTNDKQRSPDYPCYVSERQTDIMKSYLFQKPPRD